MRVKLKTSVGAAVALVVAGVLVSTGGLPGGGSDTDTNERRKYTLVGETSENYVVINMLYNTNTGRREKITDKHIYGAFRRDVWVEAGEVINIHLEADTTGKHPLGSAPWARCQILLNGGMAGGDAEVWQLKVIETAEDRHKQARTGCEIKGG